MSYTNYKGGVSLEKGPKLNEKKMCHVDKPICKSPGKDKNKKKLPKKCFVKDADYDKWMILIDGGSGGTRMFPYFYSSKVGSGPLPQKFDTFHKKGNWPVSTDCRLGAFKEEAACVDDWVDHMKKMWDWAFLSGQAIAKEPPTHILLGATAGARVQSDWETLKTRFKAVKDWASNDAPDA